MALPINLLLGLLSFVGLMVTYHTVNHLFDLQMRRFAFSISLLGCLGWPLVAFDASSLWRWVGTTAVCLWAFLAFLAALSIYHYSKTHKKR